MQSPARRAAEKDRKTAVAGRRSRRSRPPVKPDPLRSARVRHGSNGTDQWWPHDHRCCAIFVIGNDGIADYLASIRRHPWGRQVGRHAPRRKPCPSQFLATALVAGRRENLKFDGGPGILARTGTGRRTQSNGTDRDMTRDGALRCFARSASELVASSLLSRRRSHLTQGPGARQKNAAPSPFNGGASACSPCCCSSHTLNSRRIRPIGLLNLDDMRMAATCSPWRNRSAKWRMTSRSN